MPDYRHAIAPLALGTFAVGTEGLAVSGILPEISAGLHVSVSAAGQLVTVFAVTFALGAPLLAIYGSRIAPKYLLAGGLGLFAAGNVLAALTPGYGLMIAVRVLMGLSAAAFVPTASAAGAALAPPQSRGKALAVVWGGFTVATVTGVPITARIAGLASWRWAFAFIAVLASLASIGIAVLVPHIGKPPAVTARDFLRVARNPVVAGVVLVGFLMQSGQFTVYTYIAPVTRLLTGGGNLTVTGALLLFGAAAIAGNALGGAGADRIGSQRMVLMSLTVFTAAYLVFAVLGGLPRNPLTIALAAVTTIAWGIASWAFVPPQQAQLVRAAPQRSALALSLNVFALNAGIATGGALGGVILAGRHTDALPYAGATLTAAALLAAAVTGRRAWQHNSTTDPGLWKPAPWPCQAMPPAHDAIAVRGNPPRRA
jgi:predicted MFS family arabinose efflux permease